MGKAFSFITREQSIEQLLFYSVSHRKYHQRRPKMQILMLFCLIPFLTTNAVKKKTTTTTKNKQTKKHTHSRKHKKKTARSSVEC